MSEALDFSSHSVTLSVRPERGLKKRDVRIHLVTPGNDELAEQPRNVAFAAGFPYWQMSSPAALTELAIEGWTAAAGFVDRLNIDRGAAPRGLIHAAAESQATLGLVRACDENPELFENGRLALVHPHGVLHRTGGQIVKGLLASIFQRDQLLDLQGYPVGAMAAALVLDDFARNKGRGMEFATDPSSNVGEPLGRVVTARSSANVRAFGGEHDRLYPANYYRNGWQS